VERLTGGVFEWTILPKSSLSVIILHFLGLGKIKLNLNSKYGLARLQSRKKKPY